MPGLVEADDDGMYVVKFRGAGQGLKVLVAEVVVGLVARVLDAPVPDLAVVHLPSPLAKYEADEEVQDLLTASVGDNLGLDFLPAAHAYDGARTPDREDAARILWLDAFTANVDRTWSNPNLLLWHGRTYAIDHGAALYFHHGWPGRGSRPEVFAAQPFDASTHVLRDVVGDLSGRHDEFAVRVEAALDDVLAAVPDPWLEPAPGLADAGAVRGAYRANLLARLADAEAWLPGRATEEPSRGAASRRGRPDWLDRR